MPQMLHDDRANGMFSCSAVYTISNLLSQVKISCH